MNEIFRRRLIGLAVLLVAVFLFSLLLPRGAKQSGSNDGLPTTTVALDGSLPATATRAAPVTSAGPASHAALEPVPAPSPQPSAKSVTPAVTEPFPARSPVAAPAPALKAPPQPLTKPAPTSPPKTAESKPAKPAAAPPALPAPAPAPLQKQPAVPSAPASAPAATAAKPVDSSAVTAASPKPPAGTLWYVQIGSFADTGNAQTTLSLLQNIGYRGESSKIVNGAGATLYRVRLGPFPTESVARQALDKVSRQGYPQARVLSESRVN